MMKAVEALPCLLFPSVNDAHNVVLDTSPIQCTDFYYFNTSTTTYDDAESPPSEKDEQSDGSGNSSLCRRPRTSSSNLSRHLLQQDKTRRKKLKRSSTTASILNSLISASSDSSDEDGEDENKHRHGIGRQKDAHNDKNRRPLVTRKTTHDIVQYRPVKLTQRDANTMSCLDTRMAETLRLFLPRRLSVAHEWRLLYSMDQHGSSLQTLFYNVQKHLGPCLLVIQTTDEEIFGGYLSETLHMESRYYGSGECFLWRMDMQSGNPRPLVYRWAGKNDYLIYSDRNYLSLGGGDGKVGLWLNGDLLHGHTEPCATFENEPLADHTTFECLALEIWGFKF
ncbi:tld-domain-containing protein [Lichtheimia corymbifera JMRC:FSU:9682]|uniref:Oxidation resistance protein 1 n=1 Tax=Lichtheimia corymbifera JMRC:FSU:9682 TaxID=1263082 RepID=A0A068RVV4_9FUNG|nr:tld-domain-containing protein [Lichtheimia corymbifera JMRC:FSU:9682]